MKKLKLNNCIIINKQMVIPFLICLFFFFCHLFFYKIKFETNDDLTMNLISIGAYKGWKETHLVYINYIHGLLLAVLNKNFPNHNWYVYIHLIIAFISITSICCTIGKRLSLSLSAFFSCLFNYIIATSLYSYLQFTKISAIATVAAALLFYDYIVNNTTILRGGGIFLFIIGLCLRREAFFMILPFVSVLMIGSLWQIRGKIDKIKKLIFVVSICILSIISVNYINLKAYSDNDWIIYKEFNRTRAELLDIGIPSYKEYEKEYNQLNISENDINTIANWIYNDKNFFSKEKLQQWRRVEPISIFHLSFKKIYHTFKNLRYSFKRYILVKISTLCLLGGFFFLKKEKKILPIILLGLLLLEYYYFACLDRTRWYCEFGIWSTICFIVLCFVGEEFFLKDINKIFIRNRIVLIKLFLGQYIVKKNKLKYFCIVLTCFLVVLKLGISLNKYYEYKDKIVDIPQVLKFAQRTHGDKNTYILDVVTFVSEEANVFELTSDKFYEIFDNHVPAGGWGIPAPCFANMPQIPDLIKRNHLYYVANSRSAKIVQKYLSEHYCSDIIVEQAGRVANIPIWIYKKDIKKTAIINSATE